MNNLFDVNIFFYFQIMIKFQFNQFMIVFIIINFQGKSIILFHYNFCKLIIRLINAFPFL